MFFFLSFDNIPGLKRYFCHVRTRFEVCHIKTIHKLFVYFCGCLREIKSRETEGRRGMAASLKYYRNTFMSIKAVPSYHSVQKNENNI